MPEHNYSLIRHLANTSLRLNKVLICAIFLNLLMLAACYWALSKVVGEERNKVRLHFNRLIGDIRQHEDFITRVARHGNQAAQQPPASGITAQHHVLIDEPGVRIFEGAQFASSMPFTLAQRQGTTGPHPGNFVLGVILADFYSHFWSTSIYPSPQVFVLGALGKTSMAVPAVGRFAGRRLLTQDNYLATVERIHVALQTQAPAGQEDGVRWAPAQHYIADESRALLGYLAFKLPDALWWTPKRQIIAVTMLDLERINDPEQLFERPIYDRLQLLSPRGDSLIDTVGSVDGYRSGLNFSAQGLVFKMGGADTGGWVALYELTYQGFFGYAKWQLLGGAGLLLASLLGSWAAIRGYSRKVISPARQAHLEIVESDTFSRTVIQTAPVALCVLRRDDRHLIMQNPLAERLLGDTQAITQLSEHWRLNPDPAQPDGDVIFQSRYGNTLHGSFASARYRGEEVVLCAFNDISAHKEVEQRLAQASAAKSRFLATISHEIRTPLYGALGTLELLGLTELTDQQSNYLHIIERSSTTLLQLVSDVLDVSKIEAGEMVLEPAEFCPLALADDVVAEYIGTAQGKQLQLAVDVDGDVPGVVLGDARRIRQILTNLLCNALKFTEQGSVTLHLTAEVCNGLATLHWQVTDTGMGIAADQQAHLFEPFYQAHRHAHTVAGTGLGLSICAQLAQLMGGRLTVASDIGVGSCFTLSVGLALAQGDAPIAPPAAQAQRPGKLGLNLLVAEDNPINQQLLKEQLEQLGCRVTLASDGREALAHWTPAFDALLTDINMPQMDGFELVYELRRRGASLPVIAVTASGMQEETQQFIAAGIENWLIKPVSLRDLYAVLRRYARCGQPLELKAATDPIALSPRMRELFVKTLRADMHALHQAREQRQAPVVVELLHRLRGAFAAVQAKQLGQLCQALEQRLLAGHGTSTEFAALVVAVEGLLADL
ncbi:response regulator [Pseudomonas syringae]|uniref:histidine kinase n=1 Tax=Pseudomonas syringae TaxID=317 RepID=A0A9Q3ZZM1_PSESX|nr:response regulator [Pseudomonas syringae]MCF5065127.1 response regulator [Pseudomonas syringae]MCF5071944.1 response regulator [Pseudomonas syringae]MCF5116935.1 response regulator [Pseudomonas syringae]MCF5376839.1 response regulator [Pseudomonas syringae]